MKSICTVQPVLHPITSTHTPKKEEFTSIWIRYEGVKHMLHMVRSTSYTGKALLEISLISMNPVCMHVLKTQTFLDVRRARLQRPAMGLDTHLTASAFP